MHLIDHFLPFVPFNFHAPCTKYEHTWVKRLQGCHWTTIKVWAWTMFGGNGPVQMIQQVLWKQSKWILNPPTLALFLSPHFPYASVRGKNLNVEKQLHVSAEPSSCHLTAAKKPEYKTRFRETELWFNKPNFYPNSQNSPSSYFPFYLRFFVSKSRRNVICGSNWWVYYGCIFCNFQVLVFVKKQTRSLGLKARQVLRNQQTIYPHITHTKPNHFDNAMGANFQEKDAFQNILVLTV